MIILKSFNSMFKVDTLPCISKEDNFMYMDDKHFQKMRSTRIVKHVLWEAQILSCKS